MIVHAGVMSKDVYNGKFVPCYPTDKMYTVTHRAKDVTCEDCKKYVEERIAKENTDSFMKIW